MLVGKRFPTCLFNMAWKFQQTVIGWPPTHWHIVWNLFDPQSCILLLYHFAMNWGGVFDRPTSPSLFVIPIGSLSFWDPVEDVFLKHEWLSLVLFVHRENKPVEKIIHTLCKIICLKVRETLNRTFPGSKEKQKEWLARKISKDGYEKMGGDFPMPVIRHPWSTSTYQPADSSAAAPRSSSNFVDEAFPAVGTRGGIGSRGIVELPKNATKGGDFWSMNLCIRVIKYESSWCCTNHQLNEQLPCPIEEILEFAFINRPG